MEKDKNISIVIEKTNTGFSAYAKDYPVFTTGETLEEIAKNCIEAFELFYEDEHKKIKVENFDFEIDLVQLFKYYKFINANQLAKKIGMNPTLLSQYAKGHKKASKKQTNKILNGFHAIGLELTELQPV
jgi:predicted RNase H-like HicB family nuclease